VTKILPSDAAIEMIRSGDVIAVNTFGAFAHPEELNKALEAKFRATGEPPRNLTLVHAAGSGINPDVFITSNIIYD
jgi:acyl CoA:acetate/3-ketoacid CoA transferase